ncbi:hypothetical protein M422DRAFT_256559 [Sphaerobolus stellatus SS14]|uniref:Uncharacterized protein n=1 Tax=Sphaerobolus stellatus (strain SS14) TaxID=990650 RepID=A0A0C9VRH9_SPHS4|nr:hypothetical protein M422DRAFT_256559 [Sphaerobolus stellatus SS14]
MIIEADEFIPALEYLRTIDSTMEAASRTGMCGVFMKVYTPNGCKTLTVHFSKIRLYVTINNHRLHVDLAHGLMHRLNEAQLLQPEDRVRFSNKYILAPIMGFSTAADMQLWQLGSLIGVLEAKLLYGRSPRLYSKNLIDLRNRLAILLLSLRGVCFMKCEAGHFTSFIWEKGNVLKFRDSLGHNMDPQILPILYWVLSCLPSSLIESVEIIPGRMQSSGSGSCSLIAFNPIERLLDPTAPLWEPSLTGQFRDTWTRWLLGYHIQATGRGMFVNWSRCSVNPIPAIDHSPDGEVTDSPFPYIDFNIYDIEAVFPFLRHSPYHKPPEPVPHLSAPLLSPSSCYDIGDCQPASAAFDWE